ncbi:hypothetical protein GGH95_003169, partial [Coemansia sp. RSA 1836]
SSIAQQLNEQNVSPELRPSTAPSLSRNQQRHTLAVSEKTGSTPANELMTDAAAATMVTLSGDPLRRAQTLRKAVATDAAAIESSIQAPTEDALISALPTPNHATFAEGRVLL